jgi:anti-sigma factor RsiW
MMTEHVHQNCESLLGSLSEYIDGGLSPELCREIEKHLEGCENCRIVLNTTKRTIERERLFKRLNLDDYLKPTSQ